MKIYLKIHIVLDSKQIILNSNQFVLQKPRCYQFAQLNLEEFTLRKTLGG